MKTTTVVAEMVAIGLLASLWIIGFSIPINDLHFNLGDFFGFLAQVKDLILPVSAISILLLYYLGWIVNGAAFYMSGFFIKPYRNRLIKSSELGEIQFEQIRSTVYDEASPQLVSDLDTDRAAMRLARTGVLNFFMIFLVSLRYQERNLFLTILCLFLSVFSVVWTIERCKRYYRSVVFRYIELKSTIKEN